MTTAAGAKRRPKLKYRLVQPGDGPKLTELYQSVFNVYKSPEYWHWKYYQNPAGEPGMYVAVDQDTEKIIGEIGSIPVWIRVKGKDLLAAQGCDIVVAPAYQRGTPFFRLEKLAHAFNIDRGKHFEYAISIKLTYKIFTQRLGFKGVSPVRRLVKALNPTPYIARKLKLPFLSQPLGWIGKELIRGWDWLREIHKVKLAVVQADNFDDRFERLFNRVADNYGVMIIRDVKYLNWRYNLHPQEKYTTLALEGADGELRGYAICVINNTDVCRGRIVDLVIDPRDREGMRAILAGVLEYFYSRGVEVAAAWLLEHVSHVKVFREFGFTFKETPHDLMCRPINEETAPIKYLSCPGNWYFTMGDSDYF